MAFVTPAVVSSSVKRVHISKCEHKLITPTRSHALNERVTPQCVAGNKQISGSEDVSTGPSKPSAVWSSFLDDITEVCVNGGEESYQDIVVGGVPYSSTPSSAPPVTKASNTSTFWNKYINGMKKNVIGYAITESFDTYMEQYRKDIGPSPIITIRKSADKYISNTIVNQYKKMSGCATGVYSTTCTEGNSKLQADDSRILSLSSTFRNNQLSPIAKYATQYDLRRRAYQSVHLCSYEEGLIKKFPMSTQMTVMAKKEGMGICTRSNEKDICNEVENYMVYSVEKQCKQRTVQTGVYSTACNDGTVKHMADTKRIIGLAAEYRAGHISQLAKEQRKFDARKYATDVFAHECSYEESLFQDYPNMAAAMSGMGASY